MKADTISQYKILEVINANFDLSMVRVEFVNDSVISVTDLYNATIIFYLDKGVVKWRD